MSLVVTSNVNISIDQASAITMSLVVKSNVNISIDQASATPPCSLGAHLLL